MHRSIDHNSFDLLFTFKDYNRNLQESHGSHQSYFHFLIRKLQNTFTKTCCTHSSVTARQSADPVAIDVVQTDVSVVVRDGDDVVGGRHRQSKHENEQGLHNFSSYYHWTNALNKEKSTKLMPVSQIKI